jgi:hypothetical protein
VSRMNTGVLRMECVLCKGPGGQWIYLPVAFSPPYAIDNRGVYQRSTYDSIVRRLETNGSSREREHAFEGMKQRGDGEQRCKTKEEMDASYVVYCKPTGSRK